MVSFAPNAARRFSAIATVAATATLVSALPLAAQAQTHIGNGQGVQVNADLLAPLLDISVGSARAQLPSAAGGTSSVGPNAFVQNTTLIDSIVDTVLSVNASAVSASTTGGSGQVASFAQIGSVGVNNPNTTLTLGLTTPLVSSIVGPGLSNFLSLKAIRTDTTAIGGARTSTTIIEGLTARNADGTFVTVANSLLGIGATGTTTLNGNSNLTFSEASPSVTFALAGVLNLGSLATVTLNQKVNNADGSRTTNGIVVGLGTGLLGGSVLSSDVVLASSTAGVSASATAAPEPGTVGLLLTPFATGLAVQVRRRRKTGIMQQKQQKETRGVRAPRV